MTLLAVEGLRKAFRGVRAVWNVSFELDTGEMLALIGPNGAGKTTCFNMIGGQIKPDTGRILLAGRSIAGAGPRRMARQGVGRTFQVAAVFGSMTVRENVQTASLAARGRVLRFWRPARHYDPARADVLLERVGLVEQAQRPAGALAYGDVKRLELAMALARRPRLLLMDEPTAGMAPTERGALMALVRSVAASQGTAVLFIEHDLDAVFAVADRILVMDRGQIVLEGDAERVRADPALRRVYLGGPPDA